MDLVFLSDKQFSQPALPKIFQDFTFTTKPVASCRVLLRWGNPEGTEDNCEVVLNRKLPLKNCLDPEKIFEILKLNRVRRPRLVLPKPDSNYPLIGKWFVFPTGSPAEEPVTDFEQAQKSKADFFVEWINTVKKFNVYLFDLQVFFLTKKVTVKTHTGTQAVPAWDYEEISPELDQDTQKICQLAQRVVYVLGLDFGLVHAAIDVQGRPVVLDVSPVPVFPPRAARIFYDRVKNFIQSRSHSTPWPADLAGPDLLAVKESLVLLGADPEFMLRDTQTGQIIYPSEYLNKEGSLGYDERSEHREGRLFPLAEIRPEPDFCPVRLTDKIRDILAKALTFFPPHIEWLAGSLHFEQYQIGGHIHFSNLDINTRLLKALDNYLAIPLMLIEDPVASSRRRKQYGWLGSVRSKPHGGFEYRTPASWLVSPELTRGCLCLAKIVATEYRTLNKDSLTDPELQKAFYQSKKHYFYDIFQELWEDLTNTTLYSKYACYLVPLVNLISTYSHWDQNIDLRKSWGLLPPDST